MLTKKILLVNIISQYYKKYIIIKLIKYLIVLLKEHTVHY
jgi:hypothetical protein